MNSKKRFNKAQGHVEIIISMVLFVGFLIFIFVFLSPAFKTKEDIDIDSIQKKIIESISSDIGKLSVVVDTTDDCYSLIEVNEVYGDDFIEIAGYSRSYTIYYGDFFDEDIKGEISCLDLPGRNFKLGSYIEEKIIVYQKIKNLKNSYEDGSLQKSFGMEEFSFNVRGLDKNVIEELSVNKQIPANVNVVSKDIPIRVIKRDGNSYKFEELILNIRVWK